MQLYLTTLTYLTTLQKMCTQKTPKTSIKMSPPTRTRTRTRTRTLTRHPHSHTPMHAPTHTHTHTHTHTQGGHLQGVLCENESAEVWRRTMKVMPKLT